MVKITTDQRIAGHHAHNHTSARGAGVFARISVKLGAGRGLRHGCGSTVKVQLSLIFYARFFSFQVSRENGLRRKKDCGMSWLAKSRDKHTEFGESMASLSHRSSTQPYSMR